MAAGQGFTAVGRFHGNATLCVACHPDCADESCNEFTASDVAVSNVGRSCEQCGQLLPGSEPREA